MNKTAKKLVKILDQTDIILMNDDYYCYDWDLDINNLELAIDYADGASKTCYLNVENGTFRKGKFFVIDSEDDVVTLRFFKLNGIKI